MPRVEPVAVRTAELPPKAEYTGAWKSDRRDATCALLQIACADLMVRIKMRRRFFEAERFLLVFVDVCACVCDMVGAVVDHVGIIWSLLILGQRERRGARGEDEEDEQDEGRKDAR